MPTPDVDVEAILDSLDRHCVEYVVIGGFAIELHDVAVPPTRDIDITPSIEGDNLEHLAQALIELDAHFRILDGPPAGVEIPGGISAEWIAGMVSVALVTSAGPLDINLIPDGTHGYQDLVTSHIEVSFGERNVRIASLEDIIRSKEAAGRKKDILVIPALRAHQERRDT